MKIVNVSLTVYWFHFGVLCCYLFFILLEGSR